MRNADARAESRRGLVGRIYDRIQIARVRRAYVGSSFESSAHEGFAGLVADFHQGLRALDPEQRASADDRVFHTLFMGTVGIALLRAAAVRAPRAVARIAAAITPAAFAFLVGEAKHVEPAGNVLSRCRFRAEGGPELCEHVCRVPTERFCSEKLRLPLLLEPDPRSMACTWRWGAT